MKILTTLSTPPAVARSLRVLSHLLRYPGPELREHLHELTQALDEEQALGQARRDELRQLIVQLGQRPELAVQADYVQLFDSSRACSLHLFEHVHGDSRDRGPAMIDLAQTYAQAGLMLADGELPDHLPVLLEFASTQPPAQARAFLAETAHILNALFNALQQRGSAYAAVLGACLELAGEQPQAVQVPQDPPLDDCWQEPAAFDGCTQAGQSRPAMPQPIHVVRGDAARAMRPGA